MKTTPRHLYSRWPARCASVCTLAWLLPSVAAPAPAEGPALLPIAEVRPGMVGVGRTVFEGARIEEFSVQVLGVLRNTGPQQNLIIARLEGGPLKETGVIAGMSGSPVFFGGRLAGAVAYGFPFSKETIAGITPIGEMIAATSQGAQGRAAATRFPWPAGGPLAVRRVDQALLTLALQRILPRAALAAMDGQLATAPGQALQPLDLPLVFRGFGPRSFGVARELLSSCGFLPTQGGGEAQAPPGSAAALEPGSAVGVTLVDGDLDVSATGTVTLVDGQRVYAFGHPFYNLGPTQFPMTKAFVHAVFPSLYQSFKISAATDTVGTFEQDRATAIAGRLGQVPRMIPVSVGITTSRGQARRFAFRIVDDELLSPVLSYLCVMSVLESNERAFGTASVRVQTKVRLKGRNELGLDDLYALGQPSAEAAALVATPLAYMMTNEFQPVQIEAVDVQATSFETSQSAVIERAWIEREGTIRPTALLSLKVVLRTHRGEMFVHEIPLPVPASATPGRYVVSILDAETMIQTERRDLRQTSQPRDLDQLMRALSGLRRNNQLYVRLSRAELGAVVAGEPLPALPPSVLAVLTSGGQASGVLPLRVAPIWERDVPVDHAVSGARYVPLTITR
jgi:hypothetical protein